MLQHRLGWRNEAILWNRNLGEKIKRSTEGEGEVKGQKSRHHVLEIERRRTRLGWRLRGGDLAGGLEATPGPARCGFHRQIYWSNAQPSKSKYKYFPVTF
jgi:hypothetical protein